MGGKLSILICCRLILASGCVLDGSEHGGGGGGGGQTVERQEGERLKGHGDEVRTSK